MPLKTVNKFDVKYMQILNEKGQVDEKLMPDLSSTQLTDLYKAMFLAREADERMLKLQRQGRLGTLPVNKGQEAAVCGATMAMTDKDWMVGAYRELGARLMRGSKLSGEMLYYNGFEEGISLPEGSRTLPVAIVLASQIPHAVGLAYASRLKGEKDVAAVSFFGDGSTSEGDFHEALNFASVWQAPVVFFLQNNMWAISTPRHKQTHAKTLAQRAIAYDMPGIQVDGNDVLAVYKAVKEALDRAKAGEGPTLIEALTYRMGVHTTADDPTRYRKNDEVTEWELKDPILRYRNFLENKKLWNDRKQKALEEEVKKQVDEAVREFEAFEDTTPDAPFDYVFGEPDEDLKAQREEFLENLKKDSENA